MLIDTTQIGPAQAAIVYLSSSLTPGQSVTIRDSIGYLSSPQQIILSTTTGTAFADGTSSIRTSQPFASFTVSAASPTTWNLVNTFGFPLYNTVANVNSVTTSTLVGQTITIGGYLSTVSLIANTLQIQSTAQVFSSMFVSSLIVGAQPPTVLPSGTVAYISGNTQVGSTLTVGGGLSVTQDAHFSNSLTVQGAVNVAGNFTTAGNTTLQGNFTTIGSGTFNAFNMNVQSTAFVLGQGIFNSNLTVTSNLTVGQTLNTSNVNTSSVIINSGGYLQLGTTGGPTLATRTDIVPGATTAAWNSPLYTTYLSTGVLQTTNTATIGTLVVTSTISAPTVSQVIFSSAQILNPNGSLTVSSIAANTLTLSNTFILQNLQTSSVRASSVQVANFLQINSATGFISSGSIQTSSVNASQISSGSIVAGNLITPSLTVSSLTVSQTINGGNSFSTFVIPNATINNSAGQIQTSTLFTNTLTTSTLVVNSGTIQSPAGIRIQASTVTLDSSYFSSLTASTLQTSSIQTTRIIVGSPLTGSNGPNFTYITTPAPSTNIVVTGGPGDYLSPFFLSNVVPAGQNPAVAYTTAINFTANFNGQPLPPGLLISYGAILYWGGQVNSQLAITGGPTLFGAFGTNQSTSGTLSQSSFGITASLFGASAISVNFKFQYTPNANSIDSNAVVQFNNGRLYWNYALNGTTIQNSLNDISTRNLFYYGSLNFASDPRIKEDIQEANLHDCYEAIRSIPLRKFRYNQLYCSTFQVESTPRLGFLATDLQESFPNSVHPSDTLLPEVSKELLTIDTAQVEMAHLGATKYLMGEVDRLEAAIAALAAKSKVT